MYCVYFLQSLKSRAIKIGCTGDIASRLHTLDGYVAGGIRLLGAIAVYPDTRQEAFNQEANWHNTFASTCINGEWFRPAYPLRSAIKASSDTHVELINQMRDKHTLAW
jgi:hypothetical protein